MKHFCGIFIIVIFPFFSSAQEDTLHLDEVVVTAERSSVIISNLNRTVDIIPARHISLMPVKSVHDLLGIVAGVDVRQRGPAGVQADVSIRGGTFDQSLVMIDGIKIDNPQTGHLNFNLPVDLSSVSRIEVLKGGASRVLGPDAFSGAVNIITRLPEKSFIEGNIGAGQYGWYGANLTGGVRKGHFRSLVSIQRNASKGYRQDTDFGSNRFFFRGQMKWQYAAVDILAGWLDKGYGANGFYSPAFPDQYEHFRTGLTALRFTAGRHVLYEQSVFWQRTCDRFELFRSDPPPWYRGHNYHRTDGAGSEMKLKIPVSFGVTNIGLEIRREEIRSNVLGELTVDSVTVPGVNGVWYDRKKVRDIFSAYLEQRVKVNRFSTSAGILVNSTGDYEWKAYGGIDLGYKVSKDSRLFAAVNRSLRYPTFTDLYYEGPENTGNPNLKPEQALTVESGVKWFGKELSGSADVYRRYGKNLIDWVKTADTLKWHTMNLTTLTTTGLELSLVIDIPQIIDEENYWLKTVRLSWSFADAAKETGSYLSKYALDYLHHQVVLEVNHVLPGRIEAYWQMVFRDRAGSYVAYPSGEIQNYNPFFLANIRLTYKLKFISLYINVSNILNTSYVDIGNLPMPGRWISGGFTVNTEFMKKK